jgi:peptidoglycan L-alanyl-D-glutamate endopeptidase CwlK
MKDIKTIERIAMMHPKLREEVYNIYEDICERLTGKAYCRFTHTLRTFAEQRELFAKGRTKAGSIVTKAREGFSYHNYGMAIDIVIIDGKNASWDIKKDYDADGQSDWMEVVQVFNEYGWEWGGNWKFKDAPHFQKTFGYSVRSLYNMYMSGKVDENNYVRIS